tara:strand:- start:276 stop:1952 length:1677 start_codon:yes stop_codon:yes gene_type:complete
MIICSTDKGIYLKWRENKESKHKHVSFNTFKPYFYVKSSDSDKLPKTAYVKDIHGSLNLELSYEDVSKTSLDKELLTKVTWSPSRPEYAKKINKVFINRNIETYESDVAYHYRYAVDEISEIKSSPLRKWYWDMEWLQGGEHDGAITCISVHDNFLNETKLFYWLPKESNLDMKEKYINQSDSEEEMLLNFILFLNACNPDMLISWFGWKFDLPKLLQRLVYNKIDARLLSPVAQVTGISIKNNIPSINNKRVESSSAVSQPIKGRICFALDLAFERQWNDAQKGTLPSLALDYISETVLGDKKLISDKFPDKNEFFKRGWLEDTETYFDYAIKDTDLLVRIDNENYTTESVLALQRLLKAPLDACFYASNMGGIYFMRNANWIVKTGNRNSERRNYDGAMVYNPLSENTNGLHFGVAAFDYKSLYPSMMVARNISWETKSDIPTEFKVNIKTPKDFSDITEEELVYFKTDKLGLLPKAVLELQELRNSYKLKMKESYNKEDYNKWNSNQMAVKRLMASFYGVLAYQGFSWADVDLAASITASAREAIREAAFIVKEM